MRSAELSPPCGGRVRSLESGLHRPVLPWTDLSPPLKADVLRTVVLLPE
jgi:hypothetical protein